MEFLQSRFTITLRPERGAEVRVRHGVVRLEANNHAPFADGPVQISLVAERFAEVVVRYGVRLEANRGAPFADGLVKFALGI